MKSRNHLHISVFSCVACIVHSVCPCSSQGLVVVWELQLERRGRPERVSVSWEHRGQAITALCWDTSALRVFVGDTGGKVSFLRAGSSKLGKVVTADSQWKCFVSSIIMFIYVWLLKKVKALSSWCTSDKSLKKYVHNYWLRVCFCFLHFLWPFKVIRCHSWLCSSPLNGPFFTYPYSYRCH